MTNKTVLYLRVSKDKQTTDNQRLELEKLAAARGWPLSAVYEDHGISGSKNRDERRALGHMMDDAARRKFDRVLCWSVDRMGRSLAQVAQVISDLNALGIEQVYHVQGVDTSTIYGRAMVQMAAIFAELEHGIIKERIHAGLERARAEGKKLGRPALTEQDKEFVLALWNEPGKERSLRAVSRDSGLSVGSVHKILHAAGLGAL